MEKINNNKYIGYFNPAIQDDMSDLRLQVQRSMFLKLIPKIQRVHSRK